MRSIKRYIKIKKILAFLVALALVTTVVPEHVFAVTINGLGYFVGSTTRYNSMPGVNSITGAYDVRGRINNNSSYTLQTTYSNGGYTIDFEVDGVNSSIQKVANNAKVVNRGVELTVRAETTAEGLDVHLDINNPEGNGDHTYRVAMTADVQLGNNDYAAIYKKNHDGVVVTQDDKSSNSDYGAKVYIDFSPAADTLWIGDYKERLNSKFVDGGVSAYTAADAVDTAVAWSWNNTITDGEASTMTASYNLIETNKTHVKFYDLDKALIMEKEALVGGAVDLLDLADDREGYIHVWCEDVADETTCHAAGGSIIVEEENMEFYENYIKDPDAWSNINYYDTNDELTDSTEELEGDTITLPDLPDDKPGYFHVWCEDKADEATCKNGGETVTVAEDDMNFYENYIKDPDAWSNINYYDTNDELTDSTEELEGDTITLPDLPDDKPGYFHVWCEDKADEATCKNGGETVTVAEDDMNFYENYIKDPDAWSNINYYDTNDELTDSTEELEGDTITLPDLPDDKPGYFHVWCEDKADEATCKNGGETVTVAEDDMNFYENYIKDPDAWSNINYYDTNDELTDSTEELEGDTITLPDLPDDKPGYFHVWCEDKADEATCKNGGETVTVAEDDMNFYENYIKDPDAWSNINYYDTNDELTDSTEELEGDTITLPDLPDDKPGYFHVWCEDKADEATCKNGGETVTVAEDDMNFYENYIKDPDAWSNINYYDTNDELTDSTEELEGDTITLPDLPDDKPGYFHVWCEDKADEATCKNGGETVTVAEDDMNFYENYIKDPDAWSNINYYDTNDELTDSTEELEGDTITLPDLPDDKPGYFHVWCEDKADEATCKNGGETVTVAEDDMNFYENYIKDPDAWSNINYYDTNDELTDSTEELEGDTITLPDLPDDKPGYFHVWCEDKADEATCKNGGETVTVAEDDMNFYENYIVDPNYAKPEVPVIEPEQNIVDDSDDNDDIEYSVRYVSSNVDDSNSARADGGENYYTGVSQDAEPEVAVPTVDSTIRDDTIKQQLDTVKPLGVTLNESIQGEGFWGIMKGIWMYVASILLAIGFFFFILLWKRRKDDEEEEEENPSK